MDANSTPTASRGRSPATTVSVTVAAESPLGILAAIASPSPSTKTRPRTVLDAGLDTDNVGDSKIEPNADRSNMASSKLERPKELEMDSNSESASPPASPSSQAVLRRNAKGLVERSKNGRADGEAATKSPSHPSAIPATQLDVLALVTATSPPMPSRRRWALHSTPKPATSEASDAKTPIRSTGKTRRPPKSASSSDNETVSEDEATLRTHSARLKSRYRSSHIGTLPSMPQLAVLSHRAEVVLKPLDSEGGNRYSSGSRVQNQQQQKQQHYDHSSYKSQAKEARQYSDQDMTESDEDMASSIRTPIARRTVRHGFPVNGVAHQPYSPLNSNPRMAPASEPPLNRRSRRLLRSQVSGSALSNQLSCLTEESENTTDTGFRQMEGMETHESLLSYTPSQSPSNRKSQRIRRTRGKRATAPSGSETETDTELTSRRPGSETETERSISARSRESTTRVGFPNRDGNGGVYSRAGFPVPSLVDADYAANPGSHGNRSAIPSSHQRLHPLPHLPKRTGDMDDGSDSDATETDDEFFGPARAIHSSIRPPQRVVRHLASLRTQNMGPTPLDFTSTGRLDANHGYGRMNGASQTYTGHVDQDDAASGDQQPYELGLGISSAENKANGSLGLGPPRILSTPALAARPAIAAAAHDAAPGNYSPADSYSALQPYHAQPHYHHQQGQHRPPDGATRQTLGQNGQIQAPDEFTYKGAALRRLEKGASSSRKRALTAPSSLDPPLRKRGQFGLNGRVLNSTASLLEDENEAAYAHAYRQADTSSVGESGSNTPNGAGSHHQSVGSNQGYILASSPVSSLRSSLIARSEQPRNSRHRSPASHVLDFPSTRLSFDSMRSGDQTLVSNGRSLGAGSLVDSPAVLAPTATNGSPSLDTARRQSRKRRSSSVASADSSSGTKRDSFGARVNHTDASGSPRSSSDVLFPPIDSNAA